MADEMLLESMGIQNILHEGQIDQGILEVKRILAQFKDEDGQLVGPPLDLPHDIMPDSLATLCNVVLETEDESNAYEFYVNDIAIHSSLSKALDAMGIVEREHKVEIVYQMQDKFKVKPVARCSSSLPGHDDAVIAVCFSPDGRQLASGSGDKTVRFWDVFTETPLHKCEAHTHWVLCIAWSPDCKKLASGCKNGEVCIWDPSTGRQLGNTLKGHRQWITCLTWQPLHLNPKGQLLASSSKDGTIRIWNVTLCKTLLVLSSHTHSVTCVRWGGEGLLYTASQDRTIKVWRANDGILCRTLQGHGHWVNTMALSTDYALRTGAFDPGDRTLEHTGVQGMSPQDLQTRALARYNSLKGSEPEKLVSGSDDFTLFLWHPGESKKFLARMTGHQQLVNQVCFSPNGRLIASASFDRSIKLWDGKTGKFLSSLRGHVSAVYQISWSADSRLLCSGSSDSTLKVWNIKENKLMMDLPGHADEVFSVDWSPDGEKVASGGRDKVLKLWRR